MNLIYRHLFIILTAAMLCACAGKNLQPAQQVVYLKKAQSETADFPSYTISDKDIKKLNKNGVLPIFKLTRQDLIDLYPDYAPKENAPEIGILFNREEKEYSIPGNYVYAIIKAGAKARIISFDGVERQLEGIDGILLTGGDFDMPGSWYMPYTDQKLPVKRKKFPPVQKRYRAYETIINYAKDTRTPMLGICAGMQSMAMILSDQQTKIYFDLYTVTPIGHRSVPAKKVAHEIKIKEGSKLYKIIGSCGMNVNSRHFQAVVPYTAEVLDSIEISATAPDGVVEAVEFAQYPEFLGVQFHPETLAYLGDEPSQKIFNALVEDSIKFKNSRI